MSSPMGPSGSGLAIKGSGSRAAEWCAGRPAPGARCTRFLVPPQHPAGWFQLLYVDPDVLPTTMAMRSPSPAAELGEDLGRAGHPGVVETVIGVPAGSTASGLHQPRPHVVRRGLDGDRSGGNEVGRFDHRVARQGRAASSSVAPQRIAHGRTILQYPATRPAPAAAAATAIRAPRFTPGLLGRQRAGDRTFGPARGSAARAAAQ